MKYLPGMLVSFVIALLSWLLGKAYPVVGAPVFSILIGAVCVNAFPKLVSQSLFGKIELRYGIQLTSKRLLQFSVILLGFGMNLLDIAEVGKGAVIAIVAVIAAAFAVAFAVGKLLKLPGDTMTLIGVGTAICGGSAIAAVAPVIRAKDEDVASSISTIFLFNAIAVLVFPVFGRFLGMNDPSFGIWAGTAINDTSSVVAAGTAWAGATMDNAALNLATIVKLSRTLFIVPVTLFFAIYFSLRQKREKAAEFSFAKVFPWFVVFFASAAFINTYFRIPTEYSDVLVSIGKFGIVMAMAGIGLNTRLKPLLANGSRPILLGLCCWISVATISVAVISLI